MKLFRVLGIALSLLSHSYILPLSDTWAWDAAGIPRGTAGSKVKRVCRDQLLKLHPDKAGKDYNKEAYYKMQQACYCLKGDYKSCQQPESKQNTPPEPRRQEPPKKESPKQEEPPKKEWWKKTTEDYSKEWKEWFGEDFEDYFNKFKEGDHKKSTPGDDRESDEDYYRRQQESEARERARKNEEESRRRKEEEREKASFSNFDVDQCFFGPSIAYNLALRRSTLFYPAIRHDEWCNNYNSWLTLTPVGLERKDVMENYTQRFTSAGVAFSTRGYIYNTFWINWNGAFLYQTLNAYAHDGSAEASIEVFGADDFVYTFGADIMRSERGYLAVYVLAGIPLVEKLFHLRGSVLGTSGNAGLGLDAEYEYLQFAQGSMSFFMHPRILGGFAYHAERPLARDTVRVEPGATLNILLGNTIHFGDHSFEVGYDALVKSGVEIRKDYERLKVDENGHDSVYFSYNYSALCGNHIWSATLGVERDFMRHKNSFSTAAWLTLGLAF